MDAVTSIDSAGDAKEVIGLLPLVMCLWSWTIGTDIFWPNGEAESHSGRPLDATKCESPMMKY